jgi:GNAT superfamily N-acetyltransferase
MAAPLFIDVPPGRIAAVVTSLAMTVRPNPRPDPPVQGLSLELLRPVTIDRYRDLFRLVGGDFLWFSRLLMADDALEAILTDPAVEIYALNIDGNAAGLLELDFRDGASCELAFFGVAASAIGTGAGRWLMNRAIERAWGRPIDRFWVHTCSHDHPAALGFYIRSGFVPYRRQVEIVDDPRAISALPADAARHIPIL